MTSGPSRRQPSRRPARRQPVRRSRRVVRAVWGCVIGGVLIAVLVLFVFPTRTLLAQRHQLSVAASHLKVLDEQNAALSHRVDELHTDAEIERLAREQYHLVRPGEQAFAILPAPSPTTTVPPPAPAPAHHHQGFWSSTWHHLTGWL